VSKLRVKILFFLVRSLQISKRSNNYYNVNLCLLQFNYIVNKTDLKTKAVFIILGFAFETQFFRGRWPACIVDHFSLDKENADAPYTTGQL
jgi:hypothetical protein